MKGLTSRIVTVCLSVLLGFYFLIPTAIKFSTGREIPKVVKPGDPWFYHILPSQTLKLGLDLMGGLHLVLGIDFNEVFKDAALKLKSQLDELAKEKKISGISTEVTPENDVRVHYASSESWKALEKELSKFLSEQVDFKNQGKDVATLGLSDEWAKNVRRRAIDQTLETLRNRIDEFGIAEPSIQPQGEDKILVQFPGVSDSSRLKDIISRTAKLTLQMVKASPEVRGETPTYAQLQEWVAQFEKEKNIKVSTSTTYSKYVRELNTFLAGKLPQGTEVLFKKDTNVNTKESLYFPYLLDSQPVVTGDELEDAYTSYKQDDNEPQVTFKLNPAGAVRFDKATGENVGRSMAIVLDGVVHSAPFIENRIPNGQAVITQSRSLRSYQEKLNEAKDTALILRSGALPARVEFLEERVIGPSLGLDSIKAGTSSLLMGLLAVFVCMAIYYRKSGLVAVAALSLNGIFIFSILAAFEGTLTLPGLAGVTLTLGMAVDANVLIFEHMREELRMGRSVVLSITEGYARAFSAIFDSNLTTIIGAVVLLQFGYGPIRGFAVTLLIGLIASMYTAVFVTRVFFDAFVISKGKTTVSV